MCVVFPRYARKYHTQPTNKVPLDGDLSLYRYRGQHILTIHALWAVALLLADSGAPERSAELDALIEGAHNMGENLWSRDVARRELAAIVAALPPDIAAAAQARGRARDLWATARELLAEVEAAGWGK